MEWRGVAWCGERMGILMEWNGMEWNAGTWTWTSIKWKTKYSSNSLGRKVPSISGLLLHLLHLHSTFFIMFCHPTSHSPQCPHHPYHNLSPLLDLWRHLDHSISDCVPGPFDTFRPPVLGPRTSDLGSLWKIFSTERCEKGPGRASHIYIAISPVSTWLA